MSIEWRNKIKHQTSNSKSEGAISDQTFTESPCFTKYPVFTISLGSIAGRTAFLLSIGGAGETEGFKACNGVGSSSLVVKALSLPSSTIHTAEGPQCQKYYMAIVNVAWEELVPCFRVAVAASFKFSMTYLNANIHSSRSSSEFAQT